MSKKHPGMTVRCVTLPVAEPIGRSWDELGTALNTAFSLSTNLANWCVQQLYRLDTVGARMSDAAKEWYGYDAAKKTFPGWEKWAGAAKSANCVIRGVQRKYGQTRSQFMLGYNQHCLTYRYPFPFPFSNQDWRPSYAPGDFPVVSLPIPGMGRVELRLKRRADFGRQLAMFRQLQTGAVVHGEAALYRDRKNNLLLKLVGYFPVAAGNEKTHVCLLHTDPNALLVAEIDGRSPVIWNADHLRRWQADHRVYLQRTGEDMKREHRMDRRQRANFNAAREERCEKYNRRMDTGTDQIAAQVGRFCERQRVMTVAYDDSVRTYMPEGFRWAALKERIGVILAGMGVDFSDGTQERKAG